MKTYQTWSELHPMELVEAADSFTARKLFAVRHRLPVHECMARVVQLPIIETSDLVLYAINTGEFYQTHKTIVPESHGVWVQHVATTVLPRYCREIAPVSVSPDVIAEAAAALKAYYVQHLKEF